jgi:hypothetical protein
MWCVYGCVLLSVIRFVRDSHWSRVYRKGTGIRVFFENPGFYTTPSPSPGKQNNKLLLGKYWCRAAVDWSVGGCVNAVDRDVDAGPQGEEGPGGATSSSLWAWLSAYQRWHAASCRCRPPWMPLQQWWGRPGGDDEGGRQGGEGKGSGRRR